MQYTYPKENRDQYLGNITFYPVEYIPPKITESGLNFLKTVQSNFINPGAEGPTSNPHEANGFGGGSDNLVTRGSSEKTLYDQGVQLYLPQGITIQDGVAYDNIDLGVVGALAEQGIKSGSGAFGAYVQAAGKSMFDMLKQSDDRDVANLAAVRIAQSTHGRLSGTDDVAKSTLRVSVNPNTRALFKSVSLREFSFTFKLIANSAEEALEIHNIIKFFRRELYPEHILFDGPGNIPIGYKFPNRFEIRMAYNNKQVGTRILPAFLRSVSTVINPTSMSFHADGMPSEVDMSLSFGEARTLSKQDIDEGF